MSRRNFYALVALMALSLAFGAVACLDLQEDIDRIDETDGAT